MQGVPAHLEMLKASGKSRRHPSRCRFADGTGKNRICKCNRSQMYLLSCHSAAKCDYYSEK